MSEATTGLFIDAKDALLSSAAGELQLCAGAEAMVTRLLVASVPIAVLLQADDGIACAQADAVLQAAGLDAVCCHLADGNAAQAFPRPALILQAAQAQGIDLFSSWLVSARPDAIRAAGQAGCLGTVLLGDAPEPDDCFGLTINRASDLADAPRVMVPPKGGCWHDHR